MSAQEIWDQDEDIFAENHMDVFYPCITGSRTYAFLKMQSLSIVEWTAIQSFSTAEATPRLIWMISSKH